MTTIIKNTFVYQLMTYVIKKKKKNFDPLVPQWDPKEPRGDFKTILLGLFGWKLPHKQLIIVTYSSIIDSF